MVLFSLHKLNHRFVSSKQEEDGRKLGVQHSPETAIYLIVTLDNIRKDDVFPCKYPKANAEGLVERNAMIMFPFLAEKKIINQGPALSLTKSLSYLRKSNALRRHFQNERRLRCYLNDSSITDPIGVPTSPGTCAQNLNHLCQRRPTSTGIAANANLQPCIPQR